MEQKTQRWTVSKKTELILQIIKGETTIVEACRANDLKLSEVDGWIDNVTSFSQIALKGSLNCYAIISSKSRCFIRSMFRYTLELQLLLATRRARAQASISADWLYGMSQRPLCADEFP